MTDTPQQPFGNLPNDSESIGTVRNAAEHFRSFRNSAEPTEKHILTVREVARMFESAGVARTERSIINWCQPNRMGVSRLDCYFDTNERKYFITQESVERAIKEEQAKATREEVPASQSGRALNRSAQQSETATDGDGQAALQRELRDLQITNRAKDLFIEQLQGERNDFVERIVGFSRKVGELETTLKHLIPPTGTPQRDGDSLPASH